MCNKDHAPITEVNKLFIGYVAFRVVLLLIVGLALWLSTAPEAVVEGGPAEINWVPVPATATVVAEICR